MLHGFRKRLYSWVSELESRVKSKLKRSQGVLLKVLELQVSFVLLCTKLAYLNETLLHSYYVPNYTASSSYTVVFNK